MDPSTKTLAEGCFGKVYKQKYGDKWAAMKKVPMENITQQELIRECRVYETARHNNVVKLLGKPWLEDRKWNIPLEFIFGEDLETTIFNRLKSKIQPTLLFKVTVISGMCEGLNFLHSKDIVHQDLKPDNIMIEHGSHRAVIIDMGLAKFFRNGLSSAVNLGNEAYSAPEIWRGNIRDKRSDVWAMGKIIAEFCISIRLQTHGLTPFNIKDVLKDSPYCSIVSRMVVLNAAERATMAGVIGEIRQIGANTCAGRPHAGLGAPSGALGAGAIGEWRKWDPLSLFPPEAKHHAIPIAHIHHSPFPQHLPLAQFETQELGNMFPRNPFPRPLPSGEMVVKQKVIRNGKVVKYDVFKVTK